MKRLLCKMALKIMLKEKDKIGLTGKQKSQVEALFDKVDKLQAIESGFQEEDFGGKYEIKLDRYNKL